MTTILLLFSVHGQEVEAMEHAIIELKQQREGIARGLFPAT
jgi:hypothetical protein